MKRISIVTVSFNQDQFLERTILSVLAQDYPELEYIIVDPGSTDGSRAIIERYRSQVAKVIYRPDHGAAEGLNNGFSEATGDIFGFLNSDDLLLPGSLSSAMSFFAAHPDVDIVNGHSNLIGPDDTFLRRLYADRMSIKRHLYGNVILLQPSTFFRRDIFEKVGGFNINNKTIWDGELFLDMANAGGNFSLVDEFWSAYRVHAQSITGSRKLEQRMLDTRTEIFSRFMGRKPRKYDRLIALYYRVYRYISNPRDLIERLRRGSVFGRSIGN